MRRRRDAGLTHGSFYAHFDSKDALVSEACALAFGRSAEIQEATVAGVRTGEALAAIVRRYRRDTVKLASDAFGREDAPSSSAGPRPPSRSR